MARQTKLTPQKQDVPEKAPLPPPDRPLLDLPDVAINTLIRTAQEHGYITHDQINALSRRSIPSRSRTFWRCSAGWASTSSSRKR